MHPTFPLCISLATIKLVDEHSAFRRNPLPLWNVARALIKSIQRYLLVSSLRKAEKATAEIRARLEPEMGYMDLCGAYSVLDFWYRRASTRAPNPSRSDKSKVAKDYATLYQREDPDPPGRLLATHIYLFKIKYEFPSEVEVEVLVQRLRPHR